MTFKRFICTAFAIVLFMHGVSSALLGADARRIGVLLDESAVVPMRVEADFLVQIAKEIVAESDGAYSLELLVPSESGVLSRSGEKIALDSFDVVAIYQGDEIVQTTALFNDVVVNELTQFLKAKTENGVVLLGGSVALMERLGFGSQLVATPLTFGEDRAQSGVIPLNPRAAIFDGVALDRGVAWITNAGFPAFDSFSMDGPNVATLALAPVEGHANPFLVGLVNDCGAVRAQAFAFGWRVSPLFDAAPETYQKNFKRLLANMLALSGSIVAPDDCAKPRYTAPDFEPLQRALDAFVEEYDAKEYPNAEDYARRLSELRKRSAALQDSADDPKTDLAELAAASDAIYADYAALQKEALLDSPELDFDSFFFVRRDPAQMGLPENYNSNSVIPAVGYRDELCRFNLRTGESKVVYKPSHGEFIGDLELYYDGSKMMFSSPDVNASNRWRLWELPLDANGDAASDAPELEPLINDSDVDNYDGCYLPDDRVVFCSTANMTGVPCINGSGHVCNLYLKEHDGSIRQLTVEQDHDWNPVVMNNGRVMYLRWEYVDLPHAFSRIMFHMNPDGTNQSELYGSGSYWPNAIFYARPLPGDSSKFVGIVGGHHELNRVGDLVIFDPTVGRKEASGAIQRLPGYGKTVEPIACDLPIAQNWPKFLHPFPISETLFLASCKRSAQSPWEVCLVDIYDNIVPLVSEPENAALEPIPLRETERQPVLPDRVELDSQTADVFIANIYQGEGLKGVAPGVVKSLRIFSYQFAYQGMGAEPYSVGLDGPWDPRRIIGTVSVNEDGSAFFKIPAYTPISIQPLDEEGKAIQIMRSWITAQPGETVSCVGCHEPQDSTAATDPRGVASQSKPVEIEPFYGPTRGFGFEREIQPVLDRYCVECHCKDSPKVAELVAEGKVSRDVLESVKRPNETFEISRLPDFTKSEPKPALERPNYIAAQSPFSNAYYQLRRFVRTVTKESQMPTHRPYDFHADATELAQLLQRDHYDVTLDPEAWDRLTTWIDLNAPYNGSWIEMVRDNQALVKSQFARREELRKLYAPSAERLDDDPNAEQAQAPRELPETPLRVQYEYKFALEPNDFGSVSDATLEQVEVPLSDSVSLKLLRSPSGKVSMGQYEITNEQYRLFDPTFDSGIEYGDFIQFSPGERGWLLSRKDQPVVRVSYRDAERFCVWLSEKTGDEYRLPTYAEWRAAVLATPSTGESAPFWFGGLDDDYSSYENLADATHGKISPLGWTGRLDTLPGWRPVDWDVDDHSRVSAPVGSYRPNPSGFYDMQGNVSEWTSTVVSANRLVVDAATGKTVSSVERAKRVVCGGSWLRPARKSTVNDVRFFADDYLLRDVGFRVIRVEKSEE